MQGFWFWLCLADHSATPSCFRTPYPSNALTLAQTKHSPDTIGCVCQVIGRVPGTLKMTGRGADKDKAMYGEQVLPLAIFCCTFHSVQIAQAANCS